MRTRFPIAAKIALHNAGIAAGNGGSPRPVGELSVVRKCTLSLIHIYQGIAISGIVMLSPLLKGWLTFGDDGSPLRAALQLPSLAAAALERKNAFSPEALAKAEKFAMTDYLVMLAGKPPEGDTAKAFYQKVADISGLPVESVARSQGFISGYIKGLRAADHKLVSRYDVTFAVDDPYPESRSGSGGDPILDGVTRAYGGAFADYARNRCV